MTVTTWTPLPAKRVEVDGQRRDQRLAFAGAHLGDAAIVQHHAADQLHVEGPHAEHAARCLAHSGEGRNQEVVELGAVGEILPELFRAGAQRLVGQRPHLVFQAVDGFDPRPGGLHAPIVGGTENLTGKTAETDHSMVLSMMCRRLRRRTRSPERQRIATGGQRPEIVLDAKTKDR